MAVYKVLLRNGFRPNRWTDTHTHENTGWTQEAESEVFSFLSGGREAADGKSIDI